MPAAGREGQTIGKHSGLLEDPSGSGSARRATRRGSEVRDETR